MRKFSCKKDLSGWGELTSEVWGENYDNWRDWWTDHSDSSNAQTTKSVRIRYMT
jgi:hypothetical protein